MNIPLTPSAPVTAQERFFGKYRGVVRGNQDPEGRGRLQVEVPELRPGVIDWALPALPYAGDGVGFFALPPLGANIWVEYEAGHLRVPIWSGCFWLRGEIAAADALPEVVFLKTAQASIRIDNGTGEIAVTIGGSTLTLTASEAKLDSPRISLTANGATLQVTPAGLDVLQGALKVM